MCGQLCTEGTTPTAPAWTQQTGGSKLCREGIWIFGSCPGAGCSQDLGCGSEVGQPLHPHHTHSCFSELMAKLEKHKGEEEEQQSEHEEDPH